MLHREPLMENLNAALTHALYGTDDQVARALDGLRDAPCDDPVARVRDALVCNRSGRRTGVVLDDGFELPHLAQRYPDERLNFMVPAGYRPDSETGLIVLLHGGGIGSSRDVARNWLLPRQEGASYHFGDELTALDCIAVAPSNLLLDTYKRWSTPESDAYILAVVEEASHRYAVDPNRVAIAGQSMGGFGAYHVAQTIGDRFSVVGCHAGAWVYGFWEGLRGVNLYSMHGVNDAAKGVRPRFTDIAYARFVHAVLSGLHLPHVHREHAGGHSLGDPEAHAMFAEFLAESGSYVRDPFPDSVVTASRKGAFSLAPSPHFFWVTIHTEHHDTFSGTFELDHVDTTEAQPSYCTTGFRLRRIRCPGGTVQAVNRGNNRFELTVQNIYGVTLWLHPGMVDLDRPVTVVVNGEARFCDTVRCDLATAVQSYRRRRDPAAICPAKIDLVLKLDDFERVRQGIWQ
jgi:predicted esterase